MRHKVLIVDDGIAYELVIGLKQFAGVGNIEFRAATDGESGLTAAQSLRPDLILPGNKNPVINGFSLRTQKAWSRKPL